MSDQPYPAFLASAVNAVKHALAAEQTSNLPSTPATSFATSLPMAATLGGVPSSSLSLRELDAQASGLAAYPINRFSYKVNLGNAVTLLSTVCCNRPFLLEG